MMHTAKRLNTPPISAGWAIAAAFATITSLIIAVRLLRTRLSHLLKAPTPEDEVGG